MSWEDQFIKGKGTTLLSKGTAEKLNVLRVGPVRSGVYSITSEGTDADVREQFPEVFSGIGKLADFQLKLFFFFFETIYLPWGGIGFLQYSSPPHFM